MAESIFVPELSVPSCRGRSNRNARSVFPLHMVLILMTFSRTPTLTSLRERPLWQIKLRSF
jgi:hypothetical protein